MYIESQNHKILNLFISLNIDSLSSYLTPILAQYNIQYNDFVCILFQEYKNYIGSKFSYILTDKIIESQPLSKYNLRIRVQVILLEYDLNSVLKYNLNFKPLILNHILLYYFKSRYRKKYTLEIFNLIKLGLFFWWSNDLNIWQFSKSNYQFLRWYICLKTYSLANYSSRMKYLSYEVFNYKYLNQCFLNKRNYWSNLNKYNQNYKYILYRQFYTFIDKKYIIFNNNTIKDNIVYLTNYNKNIKFFKQNKINIFISRKDVELNIITEGLQNNISFIFYKNKIFNWLFFYISFLKNKENWTNYFLWKYVPIIIFLYLKKLILNLYVYNKFFIYT